MRITIDKFISNPFATEIPINITLAGEYVTIYDKWGAIIVNEERYIAKQSVVGLLKEISSRKNVHYDVIFKLSCSSAYDSFKQLLHELGFKYSTTNIRVKTILCHISDKA